MYIGLPGKQIPPPQGGVPSRFHEEHKKRVQTGLPTVKRVFLFLYTQDNLPRANSTETALK